MAEVARPASESSLPQILVVMALRLESEEVFEREHIPVLYTGVGKVNAWSLL